MVKTKEELPNYIYCSITGIRFAVRRDVLLQRIKQAGSYERLKKTYISRDARRLMKEGKSIEEIRKILGYHPETANNSLTFDVAKKSSSMARVRVQHGDHVDAFWRKADWRVDPDWDRRAMTISEIEKTTQDACLMPNHWLDKDCPSCRFYQHCKLLTKGVYRK